ncbi:MAG: signal recognition particle protein [Verrucomicrobiae bacterium]|nr:signal recognition particle protein [Verrucomicrobiae bacterium]
MFDNLTDRIGKTIRNLRGVGKLSEDNMEEALKEVRTALLSADVHFKVARQFVDQVKEACVGQEVLSSVTPGQQVVKIIHDELVKLLGEGTSELSENRPLKIMMIGLHGSGKTTTTAKLGRHLKKRGMKTLVVGCDVYRPAAIDQLETLAQNEDLLFFADRTSKDVPSIGMKASMYANQQQANAIIFDTAGRLQIDNDLVEELKRLHKTIQPDEVLLVGDSALGQEAVNVANHFHEEVGITGIVLTKLDGDARGGAALSMKTITNVPIKFAGTGEKMDDFEVFHPDRMAGRILGMGDVVSLVEQAQEKIDQDEAERMAEKMRRAEFDLNDFLSQIRQVKKLGPLEKVMGMLPGMNGIEVGDKETRQMGQTEAIILSMTPQERSKPGILNGSRRLRVANGSGTKVSDVNQLLKQFNQMKKMMKMMKSGKMKRMQKMMGRKGGGMGGFPGGFPKGF